MFYKGRIIIATFLIIILVTIRTIVTAHFGAAPHQVPLLGIALVIIGWFLGREYDKSVYKANRDTLTGLYNRRFVHERVKKIFARARKRDQKVAVVLIDLNEFKEINDTYGHEVGDQALQNITELFLTYFAQSDTIARWGGDEFLIISPFVQIEDVMYKVNRIEEVLKGNQAKYHHLTLSAGISVYPEHAQKFEELLSLADQKMYHQKSTSHMLHGPKEQNEIFL